MRGGKYQPCEEYAYKYEQIFDPVVDSDELEVFIHILDNI